MEGCPELVHYGLCGVRKWTSHTVSGQEVMMWNASFEMKMESVCHI